MAEPAGAVVPLPVTIERDEVLHFLGYPPKHSPAARIERVVTEVLPRARKLARARGSYVRLAPERAPEVGLQPLSADELVLGLVTAGDAIEAESQALLDADRLTAGLVLDAAGSAAAEEAADRMGALVASSNDTSARRAAISCRLSPGYGRWPITCQPQLFGLLPHEAVGVALSESCMMIPRKSISFAMWLGAEERVAEGVAGCARCTLEHCRYRRAAAP